MLSVIEFEYCTLYITWRLPFDLPIFLKIQSSIRRRNFKDLQRCYFQPFLVESIAREQLRIEFDGSRVHIANRYIRSSIFVICDSFSPFLLTPLFSSLPSPSSYVEFGRMLTTCQFYHCRGFLFRRPPNDLLLNDGQIHVTTIILLDIFNDPHVRIPRRDGYIVSFFPLPIRNVS